MEHYHLLYLHYLSVAHSDRYKHRHPRRAGINQHVIFTLVTVLFRDPWQSQYFLWGSPFDTPRTPWLISWLNKCAMLRQATHLLQPSTPYVNARAEYDGGFTFQYKSSSGTVKSITLYKADTESYFIRELWHYNLHQSNTKEKVMFYARSHENMSQVKSLKL